MGKKRILEDKNQNTPEGRVLSAIVPFVPTEVYLKQTYLAYGIWKAIPPVMRDLSPDELRKKFGIEDEMILKLMTIQTQGAFAKEYNVREGTLSEWNKKLDKDNPLDWIAQWAKHTTKNIVLAMAQNAMGKGGTSFVDRQTFMKTIVGFQEETKVNVTGLADMMLEAMGRKAQYTGKEKADEKEHE